MKHFTILIAATVFSFVSCVKDLRDGYEGNYLFSIHQIRGDIFHGTTLDTTYSRSGFVRKIGGPKNSLFEINYGIDTIAEFNNKILTENNDFELLSDGTLSYPGGVWPSAENSSNTWAYGHVSDKNYLVLSISVGTSHVWNKRKITANKEN